MKLEIILDSRDSAILVCDEDHNDIAEFFHSDHATVSQSYETALMLARKLVEAANVGNVITASELSKRPVAFRVPRADPSTAGEMIGVEWRLFQDEGAARDEAEALGVEYQGLYVRDGSGFRMPNEERHKLAYDTFRGGLKNTSSIPCWDDAPSWVRDVCIVAYLQGKLDAPSRC